MHTKKWNNDEVQVMWLQELLNLNNSAQQFGLALPFTYAHFKESAEE